MTFGTREDEARRFDESTSSPTKALLGALPSLRQRPQRSSRKILPLDGVSWAPQSALPPLWRARALGFANVAASIESERYFPTHPGFPTKHVESNTRNLAGLVSITWDACSAASATESLTGSVATAITLALEMKKQAESRLRPRRGNRSLGAARQALPPQLSRCWHLLLWLATSPLALRHELFRTRSCPYCFSCRF